VNFIQHFKEEIIPDLHKLFQNMEGVVGEGTFPNTFYKNSIVLLLKPISITNVNAEILKKILANQIQEHIQKMTQHF
jgi:hypothetical protein